MGTKLKPNDTLRAVRLNMRLSQDEFARRIREVGPGCEDANKRLVQRWEAGATTMPRPVYARALEKVTGLPLEALGFPAGSDAYVVEDGRGGHDLEVRASALMPAAKGPTRPQGNYSGIWLSRYEYFSSSRNSMFASLHHVVVLQHSDRLTVRSIPGSANSAVTMDLTADGSVITGTWVEETALDGHYRGARYHGAIQMIVEPTGRRMTGKWVGFGKDMDINTGPWTLAFLDPSTNKATIEKYGQPAAAE